MNEYHFSRLNKWKRMYYRKLLDAIKHSEPTVKAPPFMNTDALMEVAKAVNYDHPELFFVDFRHLNFYVTSAGVLHQINYLVKKSLRSIAVAEAEKGISCILEECKKANPKDDYEKCRWIHNYIVRNIRYNYDALKQPDGYPDAFTIIGVVSDRLAVCEGISKTYKLLCDRLGVESIVAHGTSSLEGLGEGISHAWNIVKINNEYTHVDATWDIGVSEPCNHTRYDYFCLSDTQIQTDHIYGLYPECKTEKLSYFWKRNRIFNGSTQLQKYLEAELKKGNSVLYFKVVGSKYSPSLLTKRIQDMVSHRIATFYEKSYQLEMAPNEKQQCFFFRVKQ